jgi:hypothetical protein
MLLGEEVLPRAATFDMRIMMVAMMIHLVLSIIYRLIAAVLVNG